MRINDLPYQFRYAQYQAGLHSLYEPTEAELGVLSSAVKRAWALFGDELNSPCHDPIIGLFCFDCEQCSGDFRNADGICCSSPDGDYIGFAKQALEQGSEYMQFLLLHELAHSIAAPEGHSPHYEALLNRWLACYNARFGLDLGNDLVTYNDERP